MKIPTLPEVRKYFSENEFYNAKEESEKFYDYNLSVGWIVGKKRTPMKDWQAAARTWNRNAIQYAKEKGTYRMNGHQSNGFKFDAEAEKKKVYAPNDLFKK